KDLAGKSAPNWHPEEAVTRAEALRMITWAGAYAAMDEKNRGTLEVGKKADITVFSKDLMTVPEPEILTAKTVYTIVNGKVVYEGR
ncbi:MAG: amidohydrolase family protein, partial [Caulobacteraceae bacterium]